MKSHAAHHSFTPQKEARDLTKYAWLSIAASIATIALKTGAWAETGSVGLLSDAAESTVNLVAAVVALIALKVAARPATERFLYGRAKAEYFSAAVEGAMIFVAAAVILVTSVERFVNPKPLANIEIGLVIAIIASVINGVVALVLIRAGKANNSITLRADGHHLLTDVWTSAGVLVGVVLVWLTGWERLDPVVAFAVGVNIIVTGVKLISESVSGLLDKTLDEEYNEKIAEILRNHTDEHVTFHGLQTREAGQRMFMNVHVQVPDEWTVHRAHEFAHHVEDSIVAQFPQMEAIVHIEPISDPSSYNDIPGAEVRIYPDETGKKPRRVTT